MWKKKLGHLEVLVPCAGSVIAVAGIAAILGLRINTSYSLPLGLYQVTLDEAAPLIEFCPSEPFASESSHRGYRSRGLICPDGAVPLLKPIVARTGDVVTVTDAGLSVNGASVPNTGPLQHDRLGRQLKAWPLGRYKVAPGTVWVASTYNAGSYDSRYMGPVDKRLIRRRLRPLWCFSG